MRSRTLLCQREPIIVKVFLLLHRWIKTNSVMLTNAASLVATTGVTSVLGFAYWWVAARRFPPEAIGIASASISAMMLLGSLCALGLGTLLITELPRQPGQEASLISTALIIVGAVGGGVGVLFALVAPYASVQFQPLRASVLDIVIFAIGVSQTAITLVLDQALIGLLRGGVQLWRNTLFAIAKLAGLFVVGLWLSREEGVAIYATWAIGGVLSLVVLAIPTVFKKSGPRRNYLPQWGLLKKLGLPALQHHLLNLALQAPTLTLPVLVTALLSATMNAWFYVSWMMVNFVFLIPSALTTVLHAMNSAQPSTLAQKARSTISIALMTSVVANCLLLFDTKQVLGLFGNNYAEQAAWSMRILVLAAFPLIIKTHYISICRIQDRIAQAMVSMVPGGLLELGAAVVGAHFGGLSGLSLGWTAAIYIESLFMVRTVYKAVWSVEIVSESTELDYAEAEAIWLLETSTMSAIGQGYMGVEAAWLIETSTLPAIRKVHKEADEHKKDLLAGGTNGHHGSGRLRLKPPQLQRYTSYHSSMPTTDPHVMPRMPDRKQDESTFVEVER